MSSISLCMIAKDEERFIAQAIGSVRPIVSEIILVDTGSTDSTVEIAKKMGAQTYFMPWRDDFSAPRNLSLQYATGDWIFILDADEAIARSDLDELIRLTKDTTKCIEFLQRHYSDDHRLSDFRPVSGEYPEWEKGQGGYFESNCVRLFPNHAGIHYRGRVHELVEHSIREIGKHQIVRTNVRIHHYGHCTEVKKEKNKSRIYTPLGKAKTVEAPRDWKNFFELGVEHNNNGRLEESVAAFLTSVKLNPNYTPTWINLGYVQCELGQYQQAIASLRNAIAINPKEDEAYCNMGVVYMRTRNYPAAEQHFRKAIALNKTYVNAYCNLGTCLALNGRLSEAVNIYLRVLEMFPGCVKAHSEVGALYLSGKVYEKAEYHLRRAVVLGSDDGRVYLHLGQLYKLMKRNIEAVAHFQRFCQIEEERCQGNFSEAQKEIIRKIHRQCDALTNQALLGQSLAVSSEVRDRGRDEVSRIREDSAREIADQKKISQLIEYGDFEEENASEGRVVQQDQSQMPSEAQSVEQKEEKTEGNKKSERKTKPQTKSRTKTKKSTQSKKKTQTKKTQGKKSQSKKTQNKKTSSKKKSKGSGTRKR